MFGGEEGAALGLLVELLVLLLSEPLELDCRSRSIEPIELSGCLQAVRNQEQEQLQEALTLEFTGVSAFDAAMTRGKLRISPRNLIGLQLRAIGSSRSMILQRKNQIFKVSAGTPLAPDHDHRSALQPSLGSSLLLSRMKSTLSWMGPLALPTPILTQKS